MTATVLQFRRPVTKPSGNEIGALWWTAYRANHALLLAWARLWGFV